MRSKHKEDTIPNSFNHCLMGELGNGGINPRNTKLSSSSNLPTLAVAASKLDISDAVFTVFELLMMGGETA
jgi:hypothetical protein